MMEAPRRRRSTPPAWPWWMRAFSSFAAASAARGRDDARRPGRAEAGHRVASIWRVCRASAGWRTCRRRRCSRTPTMLIARALDAASKVGEQPPRRAEPCPPGRGAGGRRSLADSAGAVQRRGARARGFGDGDLPLPFARGAAFVDRPPSSRRRTRGSGPRRHAPGRRLAVAAINTLGHVDVVAASFLDPSSPPRLRS